ncbi:MAG: hypothetical protein ACQERU_07730 [Bacteroidota bacterium]
MKGKFKSILFVLFLSIKVAFVYPQTAEITTDSLLKLTNIGLEDYLNLIKMDNVKNYGFSSIEDLDSIKLGSPIQTFLFSQLFYKDSILRNIEYIFSKEEFRIPLIVNDTIRSFIIIAKLKNKWSIVGVGGNILADNLMQCLNKNRINTKRGLILLREPLSQSDYLISDFENKNTVPTYFPVISSMNCLNRELPEKGMTKKEILPLIHQKYYSNKHMFKFDGYEKNN